MKMRPKLLIRTAARAPSEDWPGGLLQFCRRAAGSANPGVPGFVGRSRAAWGREAGPNLVCKDAKLVLKKKNHAPPAWLQVCPTRSQAHQIMGERQFNCARKGAATLLVCPNVSETCHAAPHGMDSAFVAIRGYPTASRHCPIERFTDWAAVRPLPPCSVVIGTAADKHSGRKGRNREQLHSSPNSRLGQEHPYQLG